MRVPTVFAKVRKIPINVPGAGVWGLVQDGGGGMGLPLENEGKGKGVGRAGGGEGKGKGAGKSRRVKTTL